MRRFVFGNKGHNRPLSMIIVLMVCGFLATASVASSASEKPLNIVTFIERPLIYQQETQPAGVVVELVSEMLERAKVDYTFKLMPPKRALLTTAESANFCVFPIERSQEREANFQWVSPVLISRHGFYSHPDKPIKLVTLDDARSYKLGSYLGSGVGEYLESFGFEVEYAGRNELNARKLEKKRIDLWASDTLSASFLIKDNRLAISDPELVFFTTVRAMGCNLSVDPEIVKRLQKTITAMYRDGTVDRIYSSSN